MKLTDEKKQELIKIALKARENAYIPYSHYAVGAALLTKSGKIYTGCNIENAAFPVTVCGERTAMFKAVSEGDRDFDTIVVATRDGGSPCGSCRQVMAEFALDMTVIQVDENGSITNECSVSDLLPGAFTPANLL